MESQSAPTWDYGAPALPLTSSRRGRCAECLHPILDGEDAHHVPPTHYRDQANAPAVRPYQHKECPK